MAPPRAAGSQSESGEKLSQAARRSFGVGAVVANTLGAAVVFAFAFLLPVPIDSDESARLAVLNGIVGAIYLAVTLPLGYLWGNRYRRPIERWLLAGRPPNQAEREYTLRLPFRLTMISAIFWTGAALLFGTIQLFEVGVDMALLSVVLLLLGGEVTSAFGYLIIERAYRPVTALALRDNPPTSPVTPGVRTRLTTAWSLGTGIPLLGIAAILLTVLFGADIDPEEAAGAALFLVGTAVVVGPLAVHLAARAIADPLYAIRDAMARVEEGFFDVEVPVDDGSEIGLVEAGFNRMAAGLGERERLRDLFGRHVGREVATAAAEGEVALGGEEREIAALFVDVVGSTELAASRPPREVVELLNRFFRIVVEVVELLNRFFLIVVEVVEDHRGLVNKFEGDAALSVFGAPVATEDPAADSLAAARALRLRLAEEVPELDFGIGVSAGAAVAGNIGAEERYEYTVIGDPVNEAARLCELAKQRPERVLASDAVLERANATEASRWTLGETVALRGRDSETRVATPAGEVAPAPLG
jgi:adenylate cyclase